MVSSFEYFRSSFEPKERQSGTLVLHFIIFFLPSKLLVNVLRWQVTCLTELPSVGRQFTWTNGHVFSKIDKAIINAEWMTNMAPIQVLVMEPLFSDHSPLSITVNQHEDNVKRPFRFYNCLAQHSSFQDRIVQGWTRRNEGMRGVWHNLKDMRREMQKLN